MCEKKRSLAVSVALSVAEAVAGNDFPSYYSHVQIDFSRILLRKESEIRCVSCAQDLLQGFKVRVDYDTPLELTITKSPPTSRHWMELERLR